MLNTLKGTLKKLKQKEAKQPVPLTEPVEDDGDEELVIETKDQSLTGVIGDMGYSGTAIGGCGSAWTRSFNMQAQPTAEKVQSERRTQKRSVGPSCQSRHAGVYVCTCMGVQSQS
eukprot:m.49723 g.49723  ORF g.49723 m.49723 type:complete len:115 (-) comp11115_c0_seq4:870-1214(-)